jgi:hypothetical protein
MAEKAEGGLVGDSKILIAKLPVNAYFRMDDSTMQAQESLGGGRLAMFLVV